MIQRRPECDQFTVMVGLMNLAEHLPAEEAAGMDLAQVRERLLARALDFNDYLRQLCHLAQRTNSMESKRSLSLKISELIAGSKSRSPERAGEAGAGCHLVPSAQSQGAAGGLTPPLGSANPPENAEAPAGTPGSPDPLAKYAGLRGLVASLSPVDFFVYSASVSFNPSVKCVADLLDPANAGGIVFTVTARMPLEPARHGPYIRLLKKHLGANSVLLQVRREGALDSILASAHVAPEAPSPESAVLRPVPRYFDEDYSDEEPERPLKVPGPAGTYSFFRHSSFLLARYATSKLVPREDDRYVTQRLLQVKLQRGRKSSS